MILFDWHKFVGSLFQAMQDRSKTYGPVYREQIGDRLAVIVSDIDEYRKVMQVDGKYPRRCELEPMAYYRKLKDMPLGTVNA